MASVLTSKNERAEMTEMIKEATKHAENFNDVNAFLWGLADVICIDDLKICLAKFPVATDFKEDGTMQINPALLDRVRDSGRMSEFEAWFSQAIARAAKSMRRQNGTEGDGKGNGEATVAVLKLLNE